jgi:PPOX class probable F420-dependent enzyme
VSTRMSQAERDEFLAGVHVGVLGVAGGDDRGPLLVPVWYSYQPGGLISVSTDRDSRKARAVAAAGRVSLCAQDERPPYKYVTVEGPAVIEEISLGERRELARRYLGVQEGDAYIDSIPDSDEVVLRITPERWLSVDFGKDDG